MRAALEINGSCPYPTVAPLPRGYVRFTEIGSHPGDFLAGVTDVRRREDAEDLARIMAEVTGASPVMWGGSILGFGDAVYRPVPK